mmetsp:Transcript_98929/g.191038  ORF Transcript_98929/g.191038 Transcript_98929/m.191038 type:complete len:289 (-) Transcript_98929:186-1052(-)
MAALDGVSHAYLQSLGLPMQPVAMAVLTRHVWSVSASSAPTKATAEKPVAPSATAVAEGAAAQPTKASTKADTRLSKFMTNALRHDAVKLGLSLRPDGYVPLAELLALKDFQKAQADIEAVRRVVAESDKQRFSLVTLNGEPYVRANQGHSQKLMEIIREDQLLEQLLPTHPLPDLCVHGTQLKFWPSILAKGLLVGSRMHVHFAPRLPPREAGDEAVVSGMRQTCDCIVFLDLARALQAGLPVYKSSNEVLLTPGFEGAVPPSLFLKAVRRDDLSPIWTNAELSGSE